MAKLMILEITLTDDADEVAFESALHNRDDVLWTERIDQ